MIVYGETDLKTLKKAQLVEQLEVLIPKLEQTEAQAEEFKNKWYYTSAEFQNYKKRVIAEQSRTSKQGKVDCIKSLLPILDNLYRAVEQMESDSDKKGVELIIKMFEENLASMGVSVVDPKPNDVFDPTYCEAIMAQHIEEQPEGLVITTYLKGYVLEDVVIRYAQVVVTN